MMDRLFELILFAAGIQGLIIIIFLITTIKSNFELMEKLSVVIPAHNEEGDIRKVVGAFHLKLKKEILFDQTGPPKQGDNF